MGPASARRLRGASPSVPAAASFPACGRVLSPRKERHTCWSGDEKRVILYFGYVPSGRRWSGLDDSAAPVSAGAASGAAAPPRRSQCEQRHFTWGQGRRSRRPLRAAPHTEPKSTPSSAPGASVRLRETRAASATSSRWELHVQPWATPACPQGLRGENRPWRTPAAGTTRN